MEIFVNKLLSFIIISVLGIAGSAAVSAADGTAVYNSLCIACHGSGVGGAPKLDDKDAWKDRIAKGEDELVKSAINGMQGYNGVMPPRGGNPNLSDEEIRAAVVYMMEQAK